MAPRPVLFGEVLFDHFPDASRVLGGAPFNVARHLAGLGLDPLFIGRVGDDAEGAEVRAAFEQAGMDLAGLQFDAEHPTGRVEVTLRDGQPSYEIVANAAWDFVDASTLPELPADWLLVHGSLALRSPATRAAFERLCVTGPSGPGTRLLDVNLRAPFWEAAAVRALLDGCGIIKLNEDEAHALGIGTDEAALAQLLATSGAQLCVVTRGARGALALAAGERLVSGAPSQGAGAPAVVDTVGAGDAFTALLVLAFCRGWNTETTLRRALEFAESIVGIRGATPAPGSAPAFYARYLERWRP